MEKEIKYNDATDGPYDEWAQMMYDSGFTVPYATVMAELNVSRNWVYEFIQPAVQCVKYNIDAKQMLGIEAKSLLFFHEEQLREFLISAAAYTRQTRVVNLDDYVIGGGQAVYEASFETKKKLGLNGKRYSYGFVPQEILDYLHLDLENVNERNRRAYPEIPVQEFDWWDGSKLHPSLYPSTETAYREAFRRGYIKIVIMGKTIFVPDIDGGSYAHSMTIRA